MYLEILGRVVAAFFTLFIIARILGKKQIRQLTFFNYISGITFGSISATVALNRTLPFWPVFTGMIAWGALTLVTEYLVLKSNKARVVLEGEPRVLIKQGKILEGSLREEKMTVKELAMLLRQQKVFALSTVDYALLEADGKLSVLMKVPQQSVTKQDLQSPSGQPTPATYGTQVILEGQILTHNMQEIQKDQQWLKQQLQQQGITSLEKVFYAEVLSDGKLYVDTYDDQLH